jgi:hypothetical protein
MSTFFTLYTTADRRCYEITIYYVRLAPDMLGQDWLVSDVYILMKLEIDILKVGNAEVIKRP